MEEHAVDHLALALGHVAHDRVRDGVVLGGGLSQVEELYTRGRDAVTARIFNDELRTPIRRHELGDSAGVIGAALLASSSTNRRTDGPTN